MNSNRSRCIAAGGLLAVGLGIGAALAATPGVASADDFQVSIDGFDLLPTAGNTATATSGLGDIAIAIGNGSVAQANGIFDSAFADGAGTTAAAGGLASLLDTAFVVGNGSTGTAGAGIFDLAWVFGADSHAAAGLAGDFDLAAAFGDMLTALAQSGSFYVDIPPLPLF